MVAKNDKPKEEIDLSALCVNDDVDERDFGGLVLTFKKTPQPLVIKEIIRRRGITNEDLEYGIVDTIVSPSIPREMWFDDVNGVSLSNKAKIWAICEEYAGLNVNNFRDVG